MEWDESILCIVPSVIFVSETALALVHMAAGLWSQQAPYISLSNSQTSPSCMKYCHEMQCSFAMCELN